MVRCYGPPPVTKQRIRLIKDQAQTSSLFALGVILPLEDRTAFESLV